ncbi:MAG: hypothetical protein JST49_06020, partial [Bacteroidetes bacterium]|nr:hypothetical protein [Bacteroidota bacterium]
TLLAFDKPLDIEHAKIATLLSSVLAGILGFAWLKMATGRKKGSAEN